MVCNWSYWPAFNADEELDINASAAIPLTECTFSEGESNTPFRYGRRAWYEENIVSPFPPAMEKTLLNLVPYV